MNSQELIDAQFDRAVEIIQSLPKTGPIQTGYDEKLTMYSLYKQATVGNVKGPRPGLWDMLGRAKWDAWAKHKDLDSYEAKWLYVDALLKVLRRYSDATVARDLVRELESYHGDPSNILMTGSQSRTAHSDSSSDDGGDISSAAYRSAQLAAHRAQSHDPAIPHQSEDETSEDGGSADDEDDGQEQLYPPPLPPQIVREGARSPQSSSSRYRTPLNASFAMTPASVPSTQPRGVATPSAFGGGALEPAPYTAPPYGTAQHQLQQRQQQILHAASASVPPSFSSPSPFSSPPPQHLQPPYRRPPSLPHMYTHARPHPLESLAPRPQSAFALERTIEGMQAHLAALSERIETLETRAVHHSGSLSVSGPIGSPRAGVGSIGGSGDDDSFGLWSTAARTLVRVLRAGSDGHSSPAFVVVRRLFLDLSFILAVLALLRALWRRTGVRRREIVYALRALVWAVFGRRPAPARTLVNKGVSEQA